MTKYSEAEKAKSFGSFLSDYGHIILLAFFLIFFLYQNKVFFETNQAPPYADTNHHLTLAKQYYRVLFVRDFNIRDAQLHQKYPPLIYITASVFMKAFGASIQNALWSYSLFAIVFFLSLYGIGNFLGGKAGGTATAIIGLSCHFTIYMSHMFVPELPQTAMTTMALCFLLYTDRFKTKLPAYLFSVALALAMLTKWSSAFYLAGPLLIIFIFLIIRNPGSLLYFLPPAAFLGPLGYIYFKYGIDSFRKFSGGIVAQPPWMQPVFIGVVVLLIIYTFIIEKHGSDWFGENKKDAAKSAILFIRCLLIALLLCGIWYVYSLHGVISKLDFQRQEILDTRIHGNEPLLIYSLKQYFNALGLYSIPMYLFAFIGLIFVIVKRKNILEFSMLIFMAVTGTLIISSTAPPAVFYILSVFTVLFVMSGYWIGFTGKLKYPLIAVIILYGASSIAFPLLNIDPQQKAAFNMSLNDMRIGILPQNIPDKTSYKTNELLTSLIQVRDEINEGKPEMDRQPVPLGIYFDDRFRRDRKPDRGYYEREAIPCLMDYADIGGFFRFYIDGEQDWKRRTEEFTDQDMILVYGYTDEKDLQNLERKIGDEYRRKIRENSSFDIDGIRKIKVMILKRASYLP